MGQYYNFYLSQKPETTKTNYISDYIPQQYKPFGRKFGEWGHIEESSMRRVETKIKNKPTYLSIIGDYDRLYLETWWSSEKAIDMEHEEVQYEDDLILLNLDKKEYIDLDAQRGNEKAKRMGMDVFHPLGILCIHELSGYAEYIWNTKYYWMWLGDKIMTISRVDFQLMEWREEFEDMTRKYFFPYSGDVEPQNTIPEDYITLEKVYKDLLDRFEKLQRRYNSLREENIQEIRELNQKIRDLENGSGK